MNLCLQLCEEIFLSMEESNDSDTRQQNVHILEKWNMLEFIKNFIILKSLILLLEKLTTLKGMHGF